MMKIAVIAIGIILGASVLSHEEQPIDALKRAIAQSIAILSDPAFTDISKKNVQRDMLWEILTQIFDFHEFSKRVLAANWVKFTVQQRSEFTELFSNFLNLYYLTRLQDRYDNERVIVVSQDLISASKAVVRVNVLWKNQEISAEIKMLKRNASWRVYDIVALGIGAVSFYRSQFQEILRKEPPARVIEILKGKISQIEEKIHTN